MFTSGALEGVSTAISVFCAVGSFFVGDSVCSIAMCGVEAVSGALTALSALFDSIGVVERATSTSIFVATTISTVCCVGGRSSSCSSIGFGEAKGVLSTSGERAGGEVGVTGAA